MHFLKQKDIFMEYSFSPAQGSVIGRDDWKAEFA